MGSAPWPPNKKTSASSTRSSIRCSIWTMPSARNFASSSTASASPCARTSSTTRRYAFIPGRWNLMPWTSTSISTWPGPPMRRGIWSPAFPSSILPFPYPRILSRRKNSWTIANGSRGKRNARARGNDGRGPVGAAGQGGLWGGARWRATPAGRSVPARPGAVPPGGAGGYKMA